MCCGSCATGSLCLACVLRDACPAPAWQACAQFRPLALAYNVSRWQTMPARGLQRPSDHRQDINCLPLTQRTYLRNYALPPVYLKLQPLLISCCVAGDEACLSGAWRQGAGMDHPRAQLSVRATQPTRAAFGVQTPHWPIQVKARCCLAGANRASPRRHASAGPATTAAAI